MRKTRGMTSAEVGAYLFHKEFGAGVVVERVPEPEHRWRVTVGVVLDVEDCYEDAARNGVINMVADKLGIQIVWQAGETGTAYDAEKVKRVYGIETSLLEPSVSDIPVNKQGDSK